ncbi:PIG-L family deacetylase [Acidianus sp. RZ1]|uniref:PIG-L family deacetylase n=1 Tax=Acidianus sp. RZ1 TaxID=1540082 RepID=UPI0020A4D16B|nr:PIG-L family deacetylase [Acidianus sp. RZ1]
MNVLVIAPHPDDETLCCGGSIMKFLEAGGKVKVVIVTDGRYGASIKELKGTEELVRIRKEESLRAFKKLGVTQFLFLDFEDTRVKDNKEKIKHSLSKDH